MIVVDACVIANALAGKDRDGEVARSLLNTDDICIPDLADAEVVSTLRNLWLNKSISLAGFSTAVNDLAVLPAERYPVLPFMHRALELRANVRPYDATYVALAERLGCSLVTIDARLARANGPKCRIEVLS